MLCNKTFLSNSCSYMQNPEKSKAKGIILYLPKVNRLNLKVSNLSQ